MIAQEIEKPKREELQALGRDAIALFIYYKDKGYSDAAAEDMAIEQLDCRYFTDRKPGEML